MRLNLVIPIYREAGTWNMLINRLQNLQGFSEIILVAYQHDPELQYYQLDKKEMVHAIHLRISKIKGRGAQMNLGISNNLQDCSLFLHSDTKLPDNAAERIQESLKMGYHWGRFDLEFASRKLIFRIIETTINWRSALSKIATGDQAIFVRNHCLAAISGYKEIAIMEDIDICKRLLQFGKPARIHQPVTTSSRRWEQNGVAATIFLMWWLRFRYWLGAKPDQLSRYYDEVR